MRQGLALIIIILIAWACSRVPVTNRVQLNLYPEKTLISMADKSYNDFLRTHSVVNGSNQSKMVKRVGQKIAKAVESYLRKHHKSNRLKGFDWKYNLVKDNTVNAWCMPGGKIVFYTGIMDICRDEKGIAVVMGHEIAHAIARHGNERMSKQLAVNAGGKTIEQLNSSNPTLAGNIFKGAYGLGSTLGLLAYSRKHEAEADEMGLMFMAMAGYDPREAPKFWQRMAAKGGKKPPVLLSTHPHDKKRIEKLNKLIPKAMKYYKK